MMKTVVKIAIALSLLGVGIFSACEKTPFTMGNYSTLCLEWEAPTDTVIEYMSGYAQIENKDGYLHYRGRRLERIISYNFYGGLLKSASLLIPVSMTSLGDLKATLDDYVYMGEISSCHTYLNQEISTLAAIGKVKKGNSWYYSVSWTQFE